MAIAALRRRLADRPADVLVAVALTGVALLLRLFDQPLPAGVGPSAIALGLLVGACLPLVWRRSRPWFVLAATAACYLTGELLDPVGDNAQSVSLACYSVARHTPAPRSMLAPGALTMALLTPELTDGRLNVFSSADTAIPLGPADYLVAAGLAAVVWLLGATLRRLHMDAARLRNLAERLRAEQRVNARRAVAAERTRIARDLHDLVAHHVSAIALQAHAVTVVLPVDSHTAGQGVAAISQAADTALDEMRGLVQLLADPLPEDGTEGAPGAAPSAIAEPPGTADRGLRDGGLPGLAHGDRSGRGAAARRAGLGVPRRTGGAAERAQARRHRPLSRRTVLPEGPVDRHGGE